MFIGGDSVIRRWLELLQDMEMDGLMDGLKVGHALKRHFFAQWMSSPEPPSCNQFRFARQQTSRFMAPVLAHSVPENADVLILRAGHTDRELLNTQGLQAHLEDLNVSTAYPWPYRVRHLTSIRRIFELRISYGRAVAHAMKYFRRYSSLPADLRREFNLPAYFDEWFWLELENVLWRYIGAQIVLERARPRVLVSAGDNHPVGYLFHTVARQLGIASIVIQHGFIGQEWLHYPLWADKICVWGEVDKQWYMARGVPAGRIAVTGNPRGITSLPIQNREAIRQKLGCVPSQRLLIWFTTYRREEWMKCFLHWLHSPAMKRLDAKIVLKLHPIEDPAIFRGRVGDNIAVLAAADLDLKLALVAADVIVHDHSSIGAEAHHCGQNVICAAVHPPYPDYYRSLVSSQIYVESPDELVDVVNSLQPPDLKIRESSCLKFGGEKASQAIAKEIRSLVFTDSGGGRKS